MNETTNRALVPALTGLGGLCAGLAVGYFVGRRRGATVVVPADTPTQLNLFSDYAERDVAETSNAYSPSPGKLTEEYLDAVKKYATVEDEDPIVPVKNVFAKLRAHTDNWDYDEEVEARMPNVPYIIHRAEYFNGESEFRQTTLTYYVGDDILTDEHDVPIRRYEKIVGTLRFGHGSEDPEIVFVRNEQLETEYEIVRCEGHYAEVILGNEIEEEYVEQDLKHSSDRRFRDWD